MQFREWIQARRMHLVGREAVDEYVAHLIREDTEILADVIEVLLNDDDEILERRYMWLTQDHIFTCQIVYPETEHGRYQVNSSQYPLKHAVRVETTATISAERRRQEPTIVVHFTTDSGLKPLTLPPVDCDKEAVSDYRRLGLMLLTQLQ